MFKRKSNDNNVEGASAAKEQKVEPIPRVLPENVITLTFVQRGWEEIAPGFLYYLPLCQSPKYMFDAAMTRQYNKFKDLWETMEIMTPKCRITNLIMLQDDLRVQNNTPTDATAFTQVVYMLKYCPKNQKQYFKLAHIDNPNTMETSTTLTYKLYPEKDNNKNNQLVKLTGFETFENLAIVPAKANLTAGFTPGQTYEVTPNTRTIKDAYIAPNINSNMAAVSGNMRPIDTAANFQSPGNTITMCKNQDNISFYKYGDEFTIPIETNLNGVRLANRRRNDFLEETQVNVTLVDGSIIAYGTEWVYPSRNRPFLCRSNYYDTQTQPITEGKHFKPLNHCFLCMPPIRKPGGQLLGQRCSIFLEQEITVRFHTSQATFDLSEDNENDLQVNQDNQVLLRRNFYPKPERVTPTGGPLCPDGTSTCKTFSDKKRKNKADKKCYDNSWEGMEAFMLDNPDVMEKLCKFEKVSSQPENSFDVTKNSPLQTGTIDFQDLKRNNAFTNFKKYWNEQTSEGVLRLYWSEEVMKYNKYYAYWITSKTSPYTLFIRQGTDIDFPNYVIFDLKGFYDKIAELSNNVCEKSSYAAPVFDKTSNVFFC